MKILAFGGYTGSGKSTVAKLVFEKYPNVFFIAPHIKTPMMEMAVPFLRRLGASEDKMAYYLDDADGKLEVINPEKYPGITGKLVLQVIGKPFRDGVDPTGDIFVLMWKETAAELVEKIKKHVLMESLRFPNEHRVLGDEATTIWIDRPGHTPLGDTYEPRLDTKYTIFNDNMPIHMLYQVESIMEKEGFF